MTLHVNYQHNCPKCRAHYIPFDRGVPCPKCGEVEAERFDFIPKAARSASFNLFQNDSYVPCAWYVNSLGDHILQILFVVLEKHREDTTGRPFSEVAAKSLALIEWGEQLYLRDHIHAIACRVREELDRERA